MILFKLIKWVLSQLYMCLFELFYKLSIGNNIFILCVGIPDIIVDTEKVVNNFYKRSSVCCIFQNSIQITFDSCMFGEYNIMCVWKFGIQI